MIASELLVGLVVVPFLLAGDDPKAFPKLKTFAPKGAGISILMPSEPKEEKTSVKTPAGEIEIATYAVEPQPGNRFEVTINRFPVRPAGKTLDEILNNRVELEVLSAGGKLVQQKKITLGANPGREILVNAGKEGMVRIRIFHIGLRTYVISLTGPKDLVSSKDATTFLNSFKLTK